MTEYIKNQFGMNVFCDKCYKDLTTDDKFVYVTPLIVLCIDCLEELKAEKHD